MVIADGMLESPWSFLCGGCGFLGLAEVRSALLQKRVERLLCVLRPNLRAELFVLGLDGRLGLLANGALQESLAGLQRAGRLRGELLRRFHRAREQVLIGYDLGHEA